MSCDNKQLFLSTKKYLVQKFSERDKIYEQKFFVRKKSSKLNTLDVKLKTKRHILVTWYKSNSNSCNNKSFTVKL